MASDNNPVAPDHFNENEDLLANKKFSDNNEDYSASSAAFAVDRPSPSTSDAQVPPDEFRKLFQRLVVNYYEWHSLEPFSILFHRNSTLNRPILQLDLLILKSRRTITSRQGSIMDTNIFSDEKLESRLYIGNLDLRITEAALIKMFSPFGKIISEDFLWHTRGPKRGEPRGYAFIQFSNKEEAVKAKEKMHGRMACGRPLVVRLASEKYPTEGLSNSSKCLEGGKAGLLGGADNRSLRDRTWRREVRLNRNNRHRKTSRCTLLQGEGRVAEGDYWPKPRFCPRKAN
ncbi:RNA-binding (RRM/RBD/RNP motifs) family protein [Striga hermonthica]|uniref:Probable RNA-binding protein 18 n=1 Tax=Striga hermonthica TaxID=68872 RepID=A0A9N7RH99_STRHE|nr:RNA-binding (RRM/RBD/RNP motifs) family protein [Striga hermonthica]